VPTEPGAGPAGTPAPRVITPAALRAWPLPQPGGGGKEGRGRVLVVGGSRSTPGAVLLAAEAALRAGAGKLSVATPSDVAVPLAVALPEAGVEGLPSDPDGSFAAAAAEAVSERVGGMRGVLIGPGMSDPEATRAIVEAALGVLADDAVVVLDAMAVTCGAVTPEALRPLGQRVVLTPNPAEMAMLLGCDDSDDRDPVALARDASERFGAVVAFSGVVAGPNGATWDDETGAAGLGTSGSGDVLSGVVAGLAARGASAEQAAVFAVHLHAQAGDRLAERVGRLGYLARELADQVPRVLAALEL